MEKFGGEIVAGCQALIIGDHRHAGKVVNVDFFVISGEIFTPPYNKITAMADMDLWICTADSVKAAMKNESFILNIHGWCGVEEKNLMRLYSSREDERRFMMDYLRSNFKEKYGIDGSGLAL